jgi:hypothetical protein
MKCDFFHLRRVTVLTLSGERNQEATCKLFRFPSTPTTIPCWKTHFKFVMFIRCHDGIINYMLVSYLVGRCIGPLKIKLTLQQRRSMGMRIHPSCPTTVRQLYNHRRGVSRSDLHTSRNIFCIPRGTPPMRSRF